MKLSLLVKRWRDEVKAAPPQNRDDQAACHAIEVCADELEAALAQQAVPASALAQRIKACIERDEQDNSDETIAALDLLREVYQTLAQQAQSCDHRLNYDGTWTGDSTSGPQAEASRTFEEWWALLDDEPPWKREIARAGWDARGSSAPLTDEISKGIAKWRSWWLAMADEAANAGTESGDYNAWLYREIVADFDRTLDGALGLRGGER